MTALKSEVTPKFDALALDSAIVGSITANRSD